MASKKTFDLLTAILLSVLMITTLALPSSKAKAATQDAVIAKLSEKYLFLCFKLPELKNMFLALKKQYASVVLDIRNGTKFRVKELETRCHHDVKRLETRIKEEKAAQAIKISQCLGFLGKVGGSVLSRCRNVYRYFTRLERMKSRRDALKRRCDIREKRLKFRAVIKEKRLRQKAKIFVAAKLNPVGSKISSIMTSIAQKIESLGGTVPQCEFLPFKPFDKKVFDQLP